MDEHLWGAKSSLPNTNVNSIRRFGRYYVRRRPHNSDVSVEELNIEIVPHVNINWPTGNLGEIDEQNRIRGKLSQRARRTAFHPFTPVMASCISNTTTVPYINNNALIDVPVQVQPLQNEKVSVASIQPDARNNNDGLIEVPVRVQTNNAVPFILGAPNNNFASFAPLGTFGAPASASRALKTTHTSHHPPVHSESLHMPLGSNRAFEATASSSRPTKRPRTSRSRRVNFDSIIPPTPQGKLSSREKNAIRQRRFRARQTNAQRLAYQVKQNIRRRNARLRQTPEQRDAARAINTARRRAARQRYRAQRQGQVAQPVITRECN